MDQMSELVDLALEKYHSLTDDQRAELATYIIPEVSLLIQSPTGLSSHLVHVYGVFTYTVPYWAEQPLGTCIWCVYLYSPLLG